MNEELVRKELDTHERRINNHSERIDKLEQSNAELKVHIQNLCSNLENLTSAIKWLLGLGVGSLVGFFFYVIQNNIF